MKKHLIPVAAVAAAILSATAAPRQADPVVMTINGKDIKQSEFEYLYNKNNLQQVAPQTIDEYVDMFVVYKLKVADAEAAGLDTTATFRDEFNGYCTELAAPYLRDSLVEKRLVQEAYDRMSRSRCVSHIMMPLGNTRAQREANRARLDSIRTAILNGADFGEMAVKYSSDRSAMRNHGSMGYITANTFPYPFEKAAYETAVGEISPVFEDAPYGFHIVKVTDERPAVGDVSARHILKLTQGLSPEEAAVKKAQIDSIAVLLKNGADFEALARAESEDPGSARQGGNLGFFGRGVMVPQFEEAAYSLQPGEISEPFATAYGYHIVQTLGYKPLPTLDEARKDIMTSMARDGRSLLPQKEYLANLRAESDIVLSSEVMDKVNTTISEATDNAAALQALKGDDSVLASFPGVDVIKVSDVAKRLNTMGDADLSLTFEEMAGVCLDETTMKYARNILHTSHPDYRNLVNEYRDGILLFEISNRKVWDRSSTDVDAQTAYFAAHRGDYTWDAPRFKGYVVFATSDSLASEAKGYLATNTIASDSLAYAMNQRFGRDVKVERVLTAKGENSIVDQIAFGGEQAQPVGKWVAWFPYGHKVLESPEEAADVKASLSTDLQQQLEADWVKELRGKYKVKINKKAIKKMAK